MSDYRPPLGDIRFVLEHIVDLEALCRLPDFSHVEPDLVYGALEEAGRYAAELVAPSNRTGDTVGAVRHDDGSVTTPDEFKAAYEQYVTSGWGSVAGPPEFGGHGFPWVVGFAVQELVTTANMALSLAPMLTHSAVELLVHHGDPEQQKRWLGKLVTGEWTGTMVLTEPDAGSDVGALTTRAVPAGDGTWRITGTKIFITWGEHDLAENIVHLVLARAPDAPPGTRGISLFVVPKYLLGDDGTPGDRNSVECVSIEHKVGIHGSPTCVMAFDEAVGYLVGDVHQGMRYMFTMMNDARLSVGLEGLAVAERAYQLAAGHAATRRQGRAVGTPKGETSLIVEHPDVRRMLLSMRAHIGAMRGLLYDTAGALDRSRHHPDETIRRGAEHRVALLTPVAKAWCTDVGVEMASLGIQVHGGMGYVEETGATQHWRDARIAPIYEGTNGIQAIDLVTRKLPMVGGDVVGDYLDEVGGLDDELADCGPEFQPLRAPLADGVAALRGATAWLLAERDERDRLAGATPYLEMFGIVAGAGYLVREAIAASRIEEDDGYRDTKLPTAQFFVEQIVPRAVALRSAVEAGAGVLYDLDPSHLPT